MVPFRFSATVSMDARSDAKDTSLLELPALSLPPIPPPRDDVVVGKPLAWKDAPCPDW